MNIFSHGENTRGRAFKSTSTIRSFTWAARARVGTRVAPFCRLLQRRSKVYKRLVIYERWLNYQYTFLSYAFKKHFSHALHLETVEIFCMHSNFQLDILFSNDLQVWH